MLIADPIDGRSSPAVPPCPKTKRDTMLKSIDMLIGLSVVMLMVSLAVTVMTQAIVTAINTRGVHLKQGLVELLTQIDPGLEKTAAKIARQVLRHPLTREMSLFGLPRTGTVIQREEFTKLLLELASGNTNDKDTQQTLKEALAANGVPEPGKTLENIRLLALNLEASTPGLANNVRQSVAILHEAAGPLVAKINAWFDQTMDRTSERFTFSTRLITFASALLVAFAIQLDSLALLNRLSSDDAFRATMLEQATPLLKQEVDAVTSDKPATSGTPVLTQEQRQQVLFLAGQGVITIPVNTKNCGGVLSCVDDWAKQWTAAWPQKSLFGVLLSTLLLSMGAPFWFRVLRELINLRSVLAGKEDVQRGERQSTQGSVDTPGGPAPASSAAVGGERGDLTAVG